MKIINCKKLAEKIKSMIVKKIVKLDNARPNLAIVLVGEREDSKLYASLKEKEAKKIGVGAHLYKCDKDISELEILKIIKYLNEDELIDAILIQLPLPDNLNADYIIKAVDPLKDVDGFHPKNLEKILNNNDSTYLIPPVFSAILEILDSINYKIKNKHVCIISNSDIFGTALSCVLKRKFANTKTTNVNDKNFIKKTNQADVLIIAVGKPKFIKKHMIKNHAIIIDVGITKQGDKVVGDVDFEDIKYKDGYLTPVPGGVGPMTIAMALKNTLELYKRRHKMK